MSRSSSSRNRFNSGLWSPSIDDEETSMPVNFPTHNIIVPGVFCRLLDMLESIHFNRLNLSGSFADRYNLSVIPE